MNITIRVSDELGAEIEKKRGDKSKADFYREILEQYLKSFQDGSNASENHTSKSEYVLRLEDEVQYLRSKVDELLRTITQEQVLHLQTQRLLPNPEPEKPIKSKHWWQFWKK
jgi:hypothetical protein